MNHSRSRLCRSLLLLLYLSLAVVSGCGESESVSDTGEGRIRLTAWYHSGQKAERDTIQAQIERFNEQHDEIEVELTIISVGMTREFIGFGHDIYASLNR